MSNAEHEKELARECIEMIKKSIRDFYAATERLENELGIEFCDPWMKHYYKDAPNAVHGYSGIKKLGELLGDEVIHPEMTYKPGEALEEELAIVEDDLILYQIAENYDYKTGVEPEAGYTFR